MKKAVKEEIKFLCEDIKVQNQYTKTNVCYFQKTEIYDYQNKKIINEIKGNREILVKQDLIGQNTNISEIDKKFLSKKNMIINT